MLRKSMVDLLTYGASALILSSALLVSQTTQPPSVSTSAPATAPATVAAPAQKGMVWVNTASGAYHSEGTKFYGKTKQGKYMTEADAQKAGYHASKSDMKK